MSGPGRPFQPSELRPETGAGPSEAELADATAMARDLEDLAAIDRIVPSPDFEDRVMAAIAMEAPARLVVTSGRAMRGGLLAGLPRLAPGRVARRGGARTPVRGPCPGAGVRAGRGASRSGR